MSLAVSIRDFERALRALLVLNVFDASSTLYWVLHGAASEANPLMAVALFGGGPVAFAVSKIALVSAAVLVLWRLREHRTARIAVAPVVALYALIGGHHLGYALARMTGLYELMGGSVVLS